MIYFIAPSGGNNSYICLKLLGTNLDGMTAYHNKGTHSDDYEIINFLSMPQKTDNTKIIITENADKNIKPYSSKRFQVSNVQNLRKRGFGENHNAIF